MNPSALHAPRVARIQRCVLSLMLFFLVWPGQGLAQRVLRVSPAPCGGCGIERRILLTVAGRDEPVVGPYMVMASDRRGRWLLSTMDRFPGFVAVYDSRGHLLRRFGGKGEGPGEHLGIDVLLVTRGDTIHTFDNTLRRHSVFSPAYQYVRSSSTPGQVFDAVELSDGSLLLNADFPTPSSVGFPLHLLDSNGEVIRSFGADVPRYRADMMYDLPRAIAAAQDGRVWTVPRLRYEPWVWSLEGKVLEVRRTPTWFPPQSSVGSGGRGRTAPATPWVSGVWHDGGENLWILLSVPDPNWTPPTPPANGRREGGPPVDWDRRYDTIVEVINTRTGELLGSSRFDELLRNLRPGGYVAHHREDSDGEPFVDIWQLSRSPSMPR